MSGDGTLSCVVQGSCGPCRLCSAPHVASTDVQPPPKKWHKPESSTKLSLEWAHRNVNGHAHAEPLLDNSILGLLGRWGLVRLRVYAGLELPQGPEYPAES